MDTKKYRLSLFDLCLYFVFIPFLYPRGFAEYFSVYKTLFLLWFYAALGVGALMVLVIVLKRNFHVKTCYMFLLLNYSFLVLITFLKTGGIATGFQKIFGPPFLVLLCLCLLEKKAFKLVRVVSNILIFNFILGFVCDYVLFRSYFSSESHIIFLGHVQVAAQLGILGLFLSYILYDVMNEKRKARILCVLCIVAMLLSATIASLTVLIVIFIWILLSKLRIGKKIMKMNAEICLLVFVVINAVLLYLSTTPIVGYNVLGNMTTFNGRLYIWREALLLLQHNWISGFGVYGINIKVFWTQWTGDGTGFNYAHNQILQTLLDGGIIQTCLFLFMWKKYLDNMKNVSDERMKLFGNLFSISFLIVMLAESVDIYYFVFIFMSLIAYLPQFSEMKQISEGERGRREWGSSVD